MEKFEKSFVERKDLINEIVYSAYAMPEFQEIIKQGKDRMEAIKSIRELLRKHFPHISQIPEPEQDGRTHASNEFIIAKDIFELLKLNEK